MNSYPKFVRYVWETWKLEFDAFVWYLSCDIIFALWIVQKLWNKSFLSSQCVTDNFQMQHFLKFCEIYNLFLWSLSLLQRRSSFYCAQIIVSSTRICHWRLICRGNFETVRLKYRQSDNYIFREFRNKYLEFLIFGWWQFHCLLIKWSDVHLAFVFQTHILPICL